MAILEFLLKITHTILVEFLVAAAWPIAAIVIARSYSGELKELLGRATELGPTGLKAIAPVQNATSIAKPTGELEQRPLTSSGSELITILEKSIEDDVRRRQWETRPASEVVALMSRELAFAQARGHFELVSATIYGSQVKLLQTLHLGGPMRIAEVMPFYENFEQQTGAKSLFADWIRYLENKALISVDDGIYKLTPVGHDFIVYYIPAAGLRPESFFF